MERVCTKPNHIGRFYKCDSPRGTECIWGCKYAARPAILAGVVRRDINAQILKGAYFFTSESRAVRICEMVIAHNLNQNGDRV